MPTRRVWFVAAATVLSYGCAPLPEADSPGGRLYVQRCANCHRAYQPAALKFEMWKIVVNRMQGVMSRNGLRPLSDAEMAVLLDYLQRNSGK
jgi:hypothetical protein